MNSEEEFEGYLEEIDEASIAGSDAHDFNKMEDKAMELAREFGKEMKLNVIETIF